MRVVELYIKFLKYLTLHTEVKVGFFLTLWQYKTLELSYFYISIYFTCSNCTKKLYLYTHQCKLDPSYSSFINHSVSVEGTHYITYKLPSSSLLFLYLATLFHSFVFVTYQWSKLKKQQGLSVNKSLAPSMKMLVNYKVYNVI